MKHDCCDLAKWFIKYKDRGNFWYVLFIREGPGAYGSFAAAIEFCPFCGVKLPESSITESTGGKGA